MCMQSARQWGVVLLAWPNMRHVGAGHAELRFLGLVYILGPHTIHLLLRRPTRDPTST